MSWMRKVEGNIRRRWLFVLILVCLFGVLIFILY